jgi:hypothetical protein
MRCRPGDRSASERAMLFPVSNSKPKDQRIPVDQ